MDLIAITDYAAELGVDSRRLRTALRAAIAAKRAPEGTLIERGKGSVAYVDRDAIRLVDLKNEESLAARMSVAETAIKDHEARLDEIEARVA